MTERNIEAIYPLSPMQQGMVFHSLHKPGSGVYCEQLHCTLRGSLDVRAFQEAWQRVVDRHSSLRTSFVWKRVEQMLQIVHRSVDVPLTCEDWQGYSSAEQKQRLAQLLEQDRREGFNLSRAPLIRLTLKRIADDAHFLVWTSHHAILDGWSLPIVLGELSACYEALRRGAEPHLAQPASYQSYIQWLHRQDMERAEEFWREALRGFTEPTSLAVNGGPMRAPSTSSRYEASAIELSTDLTKQLGSLARRHRLTMSTVVQAIWGLLLSRYSGEDDVLFGATVAGRPADLAGVETIVGLFINTLPVRIQLPSDMPVGEWLRQVQVQFTEIAKFEYSPLVQVHSWSEVPRGVSMFDSIVVFENYPVDDRVLSLSSDLTIEGFRSIEQTNYPLTVVSAPGERLPLKVQYDADRFPSDAIDRLLQHLRMLLEGILSDPSAPLATLPLLTGDEREQLVVEFNRTEMDYPRERCVHELIEGWAERRPEAEAVVHEDRSVSYRELNEQANGLAHRLRTLELGPEALVAIFLPRSVEAVVAMLGVLKAGYAYLPLDLEYPSERLEYMLADSRAVVLVTQADRVEKLPTYAGRVVLLDEEWPATGERKRHNPQVRVLPDQLAYVIYTSGSTGQPKGTLLQHRGLTNLVCLLRETFAIDEASRMLQFASLSFDASVAEILTALANGATLCVAGEDVVTSTTLLHRFLREEAITTIALPPSVLGMLEAAGLPTLHTVVSAGEQCPETIVRQWARAYRLVNGYGPTEATVATTVFECSGDEAGAPPIGRPVGNARVYVLDGCQRLVPLGVPGELCVSGVGLARGYRNRADLTAAKFIPDPFSGERGARLYRTGDLARYRADGHLEFLGRIDQQVKVRGLRIELGEIEAVLRQQPGIGDAVAVTQPAPDGTQQLLAYVVADRDDVGDSTRLRHELRSRLPEYMIPSGFLRIDRIPLTANGKVDRRALPEPAGALVAQRPPYVPPRTPIEQAVAGIWATTLGLERVGAHDDFHELGGHSLLATQLISRIRTSFGVELPIADLFESPTVAGLAQRIEEVAWGGVATGVPPLKRMPREGTLPVSFAQQRLWFLDQLVPDSAFYNVPAAVWLEGQVDTAVVRRALLEIMRRHEVLRTTFESAGGRPTQVINPEPALAFEEQDLPLMSEEDQKSEALRLANEEVQRPFDLERGPLLRTLLVKLSDTRHLLVLTLHHIVTDGWSMGVLVRELGLVYNAFSAGKPSPLLPLDIQYADFAQWQRDWLRDNVVAGQLRFWKTKLAGNGVLQLPTDRPRPPVQTWHGATEEFHLSAEVLQKLRALSRREGVTLFMTLLAAFQALLSRYADQDDVSVGTAIANRRQPELEGLIGFFVNTLVLRTDLSGNPTFRDLLRRVRAVALEAYAHQDVPFEMLVDELRPERDMSHTPLFQVTFALQNAPFDLVDLPGLRLRPFALGSGTAKFDLSLYVTESDDGLVGSFEYNVDLFDAATIRRMIGHLERVVGAVVADVETRVGTVELLGDEERGQLVAEWNATEAAYPAGLSAHEAVERWVETQPAAVAVRFEETEVEYGELDRRANQLAQYLGRLGVQRGDLVALSVERGVEMVVGVLGVLKAGAAYVPVDPGYPAERVRYMLGDSRAAVVLTQARLAETLPVGEARVVCVDADWPTIAQEATAKPAAVVGPEDVAYVIYTSGSTGRPKGTVLRHGGLVNLAEAQRVAFGIGPGSRVLQFAPLSFDASVWELFMALGNGGTLCVARQEVLASAVELQGVLVAEGVTTVTLPPSVLAVLEAGELPALRTVVAAGEPCSLELVRRWAAPGRQFFNAYGPTETTVCASMYRCRGDEATPPPIGRPVANLRVYAVDGQQRLVPVGVPGELCVGGVALAQGYLRRPGLTAAQFIPDPFSGEAGARLYRTGDRVRYLADGNLEFLGRIDQQVKVRGFRIELGEIESVLQAHPSVRETALMVHSVAPGDERLLAHVVPHDPERAPSGSDLRMHLKTHLPTYMLPAAFVMMEQLPLTPAGKVDRRALPAPDTLQADSDIPYEAPTTELQQQLVELFTEFLGATRVGIHDDFFERGGHSLLATQLVSQLRERFQVELPLRNFFEAPTVAALAERIAGADGAEGRGLQEIDDALTALEAMSADEVEVLLRKRRTPVGPDLDEA